MPDMTYAYPHIKPFTDNALTVLCKRYLAARQGVGACSRCGKEHETIPMMLERVSFGHSDFYELMASHDFFPNSPTLFNAGLNNGGTLSACFKFDVPDSMDGIMDVARKAALVQKFGGGVGFYLGNLRAKDSAIMSTHGKACGPVAVLKMYHALSAMITQGGKRAGAQMGILDVSHPDIREFIHCKDDDPQALSTFNISVSLTDEFMYEAINNPSSDAGELLIEMAESAWRTGDPGCYFVDTSEKTNPTPHLGKLTGTNPCLFSETRMLTDQGLVKIKDIERVNFWTSNGWSPGRAWYTGKRDVVNVLLSSGQSIITTPDHHFEVGDTAVSAMNLRGLKLEPFVGDGTWIGDDPLTDNIDYVRLGFALGDGHAATGTRGFYVGLGVDDGDVRMLFSEHTIHTDNNRADHVYVSAKHPLTDAKEVLGIDIAQTWERRFSDQIFRLSPTAMRLFLRGIYSANGCALQPKYRRITYKSTSLQLVRDIQLCLQALGIRNYITTNQLYQVEWPNGQYTSRRSYDLNITGAHETSLFRDTIGFVQSYKQEILNQYRYTESGRRLQPTIIAVEPVGQADVWDFNVSDNCHNGWANAYMVGNCGEVCLLDSEPCNLGSINLANFVRLDTRSADYQRLREVAGKATRFLDCILDNNVFPDPSITKASLTTRKLGLGVMGWAEMLAQLGIPYDSAEALDLAEDVMRAINDEATETSIQLAKKSGPYPGAAEGAALRNATRTCIAPTGTIAIIAGVSSGIEPFYARENTRVMGDGTTLIERIPDYGGHKPKVSHEIPWKWHIRHQASFQKYTDLAVSKTINLSESSTVENILAAYKMMWETGCKGGTVYRDRSRKEQVLSTHKLDKVVHQIAKPQITISSESRDLLATGTVKSEGLAPEPLARRAMPTTRKALCHKFQVGDTEGYLHMGFYPDGKLGEIFITASKQGSTIEGLLDGVALLTSLALQYGVPLEILTEKMTNRRFEPSGFTINPEIPTATSLLDYVFRFIDNQVNPEHHNDMDCSDTGMVCPDCNGKAIRQSGCLVCGSFCGWSKC